MRGLCEHVAMSDNMCMGGVLTRARGSVRWESSMSKDSIGTGVAWGGETVEVEPKIKSAAFYSW